MFLHIHYKHKTKNNIVTPLKNTLISIETNKSDFNTLSVLLKKERLLFRMKKINHISTVSTNSDGTVDLYVEGLDKKNRKVSVYTDSSNSKIGDDASILFTELEIVSAFDEYEEI